MQSCSVVVEEDCGLGGALSGLPDSGGADDESMAQGLGGDGHTMQTDVDDVGLTHELPGRPSQAKVNTGMCGGGVFFFSFFFHIAYCLLLSVWRN